VGLLSCLLVAACATAPAPRTAAPQGLFDDRLFGPPSETVTGDDIFVLSDEMKRFLDTEIAADIRVKGHRQALFDALYTKHRLQLNYDGAATRGAAPTFAKRAGNCLSLVIMTAAFAKAMDVPVRYQSVYLDEALSRNEDIYFFVGHVNLILGTRKIDVGVGRFGSDEKIIDFLPPIETRGVQAREIAEATIIAMYMNNRSAEALVRGQIDDAYAWAKAAIGTDPDFANSYNTLGVVYYRQPPPRRGGAGVQSGARAQAGQRARHHQPGPCPDRRRPRCGGAGAQPQAGEDRAESAVWLLRARSQSHARGRLQPGKGHVREGSGSRALLP
jgi:hypothetical protein